MRKALIAVCALLLHRAAHADNEKIVPDGTYLYAQRDTCELFMDIYDPAEGDPEGGIAPGTAFEDIPEDWTCPACGVGKEHFEKYK